MDTCMNPDFGINIKRRAIVRGVLVVVLLFLLISIMYGALGAALTVAVPENVTAVTLRHEGEVIHPLDVTLTDPADVTAFTDHLSGIGKLRQAHLSKYMWTSGAPYVIILHSAEGSQTVYRIHNMGILQMEDSPWFWFPGYSGLKDLILTYQAAQ